MTPKKTAAKKPAEKPREIDPKDIPTDEARKRVGKIYRLQKIVESKAKIYDVARRAARGAKEALLEAEVALENEIREQRLGPGPLFSPEDGVSR